jgi:hypothetical protein
MGPIGCPETSVRNYHYSLRNNPEEHTSLHLMLYIFHENECVLATTEFLRWDYPSVKLILINEVCYTVNWWNMVLKQYACMWYNLWPSLCSWPIKTMEQNLYGKANNGPQLFKKFRAFYWPRRIITLFARVCHSSVSWAKWIQPMPCHPIPLRWILILSPPIQESCQSLWLSSLF